MNFIGFAEVEAGPQKAYETILKELERRGFSVSFSRHHWIGDMPFGMVIAETDIGKVAIRWRLGKEFNLKLEEVDEGTYEDFVDETMEYLSGD